jgi:hypothetical protein
MVILPVLKKVLILHLKQDCFMTAIKPSLRNAARFIVRLQIREPTGRIRRPYPADFILAPFPDIPFDIGARCL